MYLSEGFIPRFFIVLKYKILDFSQKYDKIIIYLKAMMERVF